MDEIIKEMLEDVNTKLYELMTDYQRTANDYYDSAEENDTPEDQEKAELFDAKIAALGFLLSCVNTEDLKTKMYNELMGK